jgi:anionic cell wall polymer biosynthesis LytR-Cps2A-Psr (LCP) family protein
VGFFGNQKINVAFQTGARTLVGPGQGWGAPDYSPDGIGRGILQVMRTISGLVPGGLEFHGAAIIDFSGFDKVVEAVGGVRMCVDFGGLVDSDDKEGDNEEIWSIHRFADGTHLPNNMSATAYGGYGGAAERATRPQRAHYTEGCQELQPWQALDISRQRVQFANSDYGRHRLQQQLLKSLVAKVASTDTITNLGTIRRLQEAAGGLLTLALGGHAIEDWVLTVKDLRADSVVGIQFNGGETCGQVDVANNQCMTAETQELLQAVHDDNVFAFLATHDDWIG